MMVKSDSLGWNNVFVDLDLIKSRLDDGYYDGIISESSLKSARALAEHLRGLGLPSPIIKTAHFIQFRWGLDSIVKNEIRVGFYGYDDSVGGGKAEYSHLVASDPDNNSLRTYQKTYIDFAEATSAYEQIVGWLKNHTYVGIKES